MVKTGRTGLQGGKRMTKEWLQDLYDWHGCPELEFNGKCHDCGQLVSVVTLLNKNGQLTISGGALYKTEKAKPFFKCDGCFEKDNILRNFQECEIYSRVTGYLRPVRQFNPGKKEEFKIRTNFKF